MHDQRFTFLCTEEERSSLEWLAAFYSRSKGDTVRLLIRQAMERALKTSNDFSDDKVNGTGKEQSYAH